LILNTQNIETFKKYPQILNFEIRWFKQKYFVLTIESKIILGPRVI
jgi:hypothetical protein